MIFYSVLSPSTDYTGLKRLFNLPRYCAVVFPPLLTLSITALRLVEFSTLFSVPVIVLEKKVKTYKLDSLQMK